MTATASSPRCTAAQAPLTEAALACRAIRRSGCAPFSTYAECSEGTAEFNQFMADFLPECVPVQTRVLELHREHAARSGLGLRRRPPAACFDEQDAYFACLSGG